MRDDDESYSQEHFSSQAAAIGLYPGMPAAEMDRLVADHEERNRPAPMTNDELASDEQHRRQFDETLDRLEYAGIIEVKETPLVTEPDLGMLDHEAFYVLKRISAVQAELADIEANAKTMKAQAVADLRDFLGGYDRLQRLSLWRATNAGKGRKTVTVLTGSVGEKTVAARCIVADKGLALEWLETNCPGAIEPKIIPTKLPKPEKTINEHGEPVWVSPCAGLFAEGEREELLVNGKMVRALLAGDKDEDDAA